MKNLRKLVVTLGIVILTALTTTVVYAWYMNMNSVSQMKVNILQIDSMVTLYQAEDGNFNGVPDHQSSSNMGESGKGQYYNPDSESYIDYGSPFYTEKYAFDYVDQRYALSADSSSNLLKEVELTDIAPSKIYTFKYEIINYSGYDNTLEFSFPEDSTVDSSEVSILSNFECRLGIVNSDASLTLSEDWTDFVTNGKYTGFTLDPTGGTGMTVPKATSPYTAIGRYDLWFQIRVKSTSETTIQDYVFPEHRITLTCTTSD